MNRIFTRLIDLPTAINAVTTVDAECDYNVYINSRISSVEQRKAYEHELRHIRLGHFHSQKSAAECEREV